MNLKPSEPNGKNTKLHLATTPVVCWIGALQLIQCVLFIECIIANHIFCYCRFFRRSAFYDTEAFVLDIGILPEAPASGEENLVGYIDPNSKTPTCVTTPINDVASTLPSSDNSGTSSESSDNPRAQSSGIAHGSIVLCLVVSLVALM